MDGMRKSGRAGYAAVTWLGTFVFSHVAAVVYPGEDPTGGGPWSYSAYVAFNVVLIAVAAAGALVSLASVRPWGAAVPRWVISTSLWIGTVLLVVRGVPGLVENAVMLTGVRRGGFMGSQDISVGEFWAGIAINAYFFVGAVVLIAATRAYMRRPTDERARQPQVAGCHAAASPDGEDSG
ncbi:hypothetical protein Ais01nite_02880 [Asanoa ishikariensis]|nr:DUF3995 domain-containing protein [Asanoa ishikariensis]GIF62253.1 hypothetical protein Ais01nite_02880 [Asanoa ishikariensis]